MTDSPILESREIEQAIRHDERQKVLAEIESWLVDEKINSLVYEIVSSPIQKQIKAYINRTETRNELRAELRAKLAEMKGKTV